MAEPIKRIPVTTKDGTRVLMNEAALRIAEKHFGVMRTKVVTKETPIELLKIRKEEIIKGVPPLETPIPVETAKVDELLKAEVKKPVRKPGRK